MRKALTLALLVGSLACGEPGSNPISIQYGMRGRLVSTDGDSIPEYLVRTAHGHKFGGVMVRSEPTEEQIRYFQEILNRDYVLEEVWRKSEED